MLQPGSWRPDVRAALEDLIPRVGRHAPGYDPAAPPFAVFDWDQTVIRHDIGDALFLYQIEALGFAIDHDDFWTHLDASAPDLRDIAARLRDEAHAARPDAPGYAVWRDAFIQGYLKSGQLDPQEGFPWQTRILAGLTPAEVHRLTHEVMARELTLPLGTREVIVEGQAFTFHQGVRPYAEVLDLITVLEAQGIEAWVVSATNIWAVQAMAEHVGVNPARVIGMRTRVVDGIITGELDGEAVATWGKVSAIQRYIHPTRRPVLVAGDNITDLPMLEYSADTRLVIDRGVQALRDVAEARRAQGERWLVQPMFEVA